MMRGVLYLKFKMIFILLVVVAGISQTPQVAMEMGTSRIRN